ncbi:hypothetical protein FCI23_48180 [Actinacidiphila oryziradicis]|uniref:Uncharacterized protein n=1 Tax=Actinacidiphila oryziradicis TaxID=2571141 RepID=A0A4U0RRY7_9ACTN|nr:hypothetical protein FCI23_48180 [Actinacidiphila oryziradicis]
MASERFDGAAEEREVPDGAAVGYRLGDVGGRDRLEVVDLGADGVVQRVGVGPGERIDRQVPDGVEDLLAGGAAAVVGFGGGGGGGTGGGEGGGRGDGGGGGAQQGAGTVRHGCPSGVRIRIRTVVS